jgi:hypothetical protein
MRTEGPEFLKRQDERTYAQKLRRPWNTTGQGLIRKGQDQKDQEIQRTR